MSDPTKIVLLLDDAQKRILSSPNLLVINNYECVPDMGWPAEMIAYQWDYYDALSDTGLAVRAILQGKTQ